MRGLGKSFRLMLTIVAGDEDLENSGGDPREEKEISFL